MMRWWLPLLMALVLGILAYILNRWQRRRDGQAARHYRGRFVQLVAQLDTVTVAVNELGAIARSVQDPRVLDYYEGALRILETLLGAIHRLPPFGSDPTALDAAFFLVRDCRLRVGRTRQAFNDSLQGRQVRMEALTGQEVGSELSSGCYFCSRPPIQGRFTKVKVRIDGEVLEVLSCKICKEELESTRKIKVLHFMRDGRPVHWSHVEGYVPSEDYWNINQRDAILKTPKLELVVSRPEIGQKP